MNDNIYLTICSSFSVNTHKLPYHGGMFISAVLVLLIINISALHNVQ